MNHKEQKHLQEKLDKALYTFRKAELHEFSNYLRSPTRVVLLNFLAGLAKGLGFFIGIMILLIVITKILTQIPGVGHFFTWLSDFIRANMTNTIPQAMR